MKTIEYDLSNPKQALEALSEAMRTGDKVTVIPVDPHQEFRKAQEDGQIVQYRSLATGEWKTPENLLDFSLPPDHYRIKPDTVKGLEVHPRVAGDAMTPYGYWEKRALATEKLIIALYETHRNLMPEERKPSLDLWYIEWQETLQALEDHYTGGET